MPALRIAHTMAGARLLFRRFTLLVLRGRDGREVLTLNLTRADTSGLNFCRRTLRSARPVAFTLMRTSADTKVVLGTSGRWCHVRPFTMQFTLAVLMP